MSRCKPCPCRVPCEHQGLVPIASGATVETLINAAGGLNDSAFLEAAELRRLTEPSDGQVTADYRELNIGRWIAQVDRQIAFFKPRPPNGQRHT